MQTFYTLLVHIQVVVMVKIESFKVWKRCEITIKQYKIVCIELAGCMSYGSSPYENTRDQINKYISIWVNRPTNIFSTQMNGLPYTISRKLFPRGALIFLILWFLCFLLRVEFCVKEETLNISWIACLKLCMIIWSHQ